MRKWKFGKPEKIPKEKTQTSQKNVFQSSLSFEDIFHRIKNPENEQRYLRLMRELERSDSLNDPKILQKLVTLSLCPWDERTYNSLYYALNQSQLENILIPPDLFMVPEEKNLPSHGAILGYTSNGRPVHVALDDTCHIAMAAATKGGKTNHIAFFCQGLLDHVSSLWCFDYRKLESRKLYHVFKKRLKPIAIVNPFTLKLNVHQPPDIPGLNIDLWFSYVVDDLSRVLQLQPYSQSVYYDTLKQLSQEFGVYSGNRKCFPTFLDVIDRLQQCKAPYIEPLINKLKFLSNFLGHYARGWDPVELSKCSLVIELAGIDPLIQNLITLYLVRSQLIARQPHEKITLPHLMIVLEEALRITSEQEGNLWEVATVSRSANVHFYVCVQSLYDTSRILLENCAVHLLGPAGPETLDRMTRLMGLSAEQKAACSQGILRPGVFLARMQSGDFQKPFLLNVPLMPLAPVTEEDICKSLKNLDHLPVLTYEEKRRINTSEQTASGLSSEDYSESGKNMDTEETTHSNNSEIITLLQLIVNRPFLFSTQYFEILNIRMERGIHLKEKGIRKGFMMSHKVSGIKGQPIIFEPLPKGAQLLGIELPLRISRGSYVNDFSVFHVKNFYEKDGYHVFLEKDGVDLQAISDTERIACEVEQVNRSHIEVNIRRDLGLGFDAIVILCDTEKMRKNLQKRFKGVLSAEDYKKLCFRTLSYYFNSTYIPETETETQSGNGVRGKES